MGQQIGTSWNPGDIGRMGDPVIQSDSGNWGKQEIRETGNDGYMWQKTGTLAGRTNW